jgi:RNA-directed DNA polymerase
MSLSRLTELAKEDCERKFTSIAHFLTPETLYEAFRSLRKDASAGVDQVTHADYATQAQENIQRLWERLKGQKYRAQPLRRIYIPKEDGNERPISIPALEDKIVQKATVRLLNAIYGAPGEAWRFQRVRIPHRQGDSHPTGNRALGLWR